MLAVGTAGAALAVSIVALAGGLGWNIFDLVRKRRQNIEVIAAVEHTGSTRVMRRGTGFTASGEVTLDFPSRWVLIVLTDKGPFVSEIYDAPS